MKKVIAVVTSAILCFSLVGCKGSNKEKETDTANNETTTSTVAQKETKVFSEEKKAATYDNFLKVEVGESYDDTVKELGEPNKLVTEGDTNTYFWTLENGGSISAIVEDRKIVSMSQGLLTGESTSITIDQYNKLQDGMTIEEVQAIAGSGTLTTEEQMDGYVRSFYSYKNDDNSTAIITYHDGKLYSKCQNNLDR